MRLSAMGDICSYLMWVTLCSTCNLKWSYDILITPTKLPDLPSRGEGFFFFSLISNLSSLFNQAGLFSSDNLSFYS